MTKKRPTDTNTNWAQGGVAAVLAKDDSFETHVEDTLIAGDGLCDRAVVELCVDDGPRRSSACSISACGSIATPPATSTSAARARTRKHRVVHWEDITGREIQRALLAAVEKHSNITILDEHIAVDLLSLAKYGGDPACFGAYVLDRRTGEVQTICARATVLASGGTGKVYIYTSNPDVATGDGIAMAYRIGAACGDLEFVQFHPTVLYHPHARQLPDLRGAARRRRRAAARAPARRSWSATTRCGSLASRDIVARAIDNELKKSGADSVFLDMTALDPAFVRQRFPNIYEHCLALGIDITKQASRSCPRRTTCAAASRPTCNGATTVPGLYAIGECAFTGLHGANRLASNSLLEGMVFSTRAAEAVRDEPRRRPSQIAPWSSGNATDSNDAIVVALNWEEIRRFMWSYVGIVRSDKRLERARHRIEILRDEIREYYVDFKITSDLVELRNLALVAHLIIESARRRKESRGLHFTLDYPDKLPEARHSEIQLTDGPRG